MKLEVRYFAAYREATGLESETVETEAVSAGELFAECQARHEGLAGYEVSLVAVNDEMAHLDTGLTDGDEVLFFPPVAGG